MHVFETKRHETDDFGIKKISGFEGKICYFTISRTLRKDAQKNFFFSGRNTKRVVVVKNSLTTQQKVWVPPSPLDLLLIG